MSITEYSVDEMPKAPGGKSMPTPVVAVCSIEPPDCGVTPSDGGVESPDWVVLKVMSLLLALPPVVETTAVLLST